MYNVDVLECVDCAPYEGYDGDYLEFVYDDDGTVGGFTVRIEDDVIYLSNLSVVDMPLVRQ